MKTRPKSHFSLISGFIRAKSNKLLFLSSLMAVTAGIFLLPQTAQMAAITPEKILEFTNKERARAGLSELQPDKNLARAAAAKAEAILESQTFDHTIKGKKFSAWIKETGYEYSSAGENLAIDFITSEGVLKAWMASPEHRENILNGDYREIGLAVLEGKFEGQKTVVVAQIFGAPKSRSLVPPEIYRLDEKLLARLEIQVTAAILSLPPRLKFRTA
jgi:hypothetical protein